MAPKRAPERTIRYPNGNIYVGRTRDGKMHGLGKYTWPDGSCYVGSFVDGFQEGKGTKTSASGMSYTGEWRRDKPHGEGEMHFPSGETYSGTFRAGLFHGEGTRVLPNGNVYRGQFELGKEEGLGSFASQEGWVYTGMFLHGAMGGGEGEVRFTDGRSYVGSWRDGVFDGYGMLQWPDGSSYEGSFRAGLRHGVGTHRLADGGVYVGDHVDDLYAGEGAFHWPSGMRYEGSWRGGLMDGPGALLWPTGETLECTFDGNAPTSPARKTYPSGCTYSGEIDETGAIDGEGIFSWPDRRRFTGDFVGGVMSGRGTLEFPLPFTESLSGRGGAPAVYTGGFSEGRFHGLGVLRLPDGAVFDGSFVDGLFSGPGDYRWTLPELVYYSGEFLNGKLHGRGRLLFPNGNTYDGAFVGGAYEGQGSFSWHLHPDSDPTGSPSPAPRPGSGVVRYVGEWRHSLPHGLGCYSWEDGVTLYRGELANGVFDGKGHLVTANGDAYAGEYVRGLEQGRGVLVDSTGVRVAGQWAAGDLTCQLIEVSSDQLPSALAAEPSDATVPARDTQAPSLEPAVLELSIARSHHFSPPAIVSSAPRIALAAARGSLAGTRRETRFAGLQAVQTSPVPRQKPLQLEVSSPGPTAAGKGIVLYQDGSKYCGDVVGTSKHGIYGTFTAADGTVTRGAWDHDRPILPGNSLGPVLPLAPAGHLPPRPQSVTYMRSPPEPDAVDEPAGEGSDSGSA
jgi:hypothetical protein